MVWRQEVPAEDMVGQGEVALEHGRHLGTKVLPLAELLQHLHRQQEDLAEVFLLQSINRTCSGQTLIQNTFPFRTIKANEQKP